MQTSQISMASYRVLKQPQEVVVLMVPLPLQGHLNQLLHLSRLLSSKNVAVHYVGTATHNCQALRRVQGWDPLAISNIIFHDLIPSLPFQYYSSQPDRDGEITEFPSHLQPLFDTLSNLRQPIKNLLRVLSIRNRRVVIIHDSLMGSVVQDFVNFPNAETYTFHSVSAFTMFFFLWESMGRPFAINDAEMMESLPSLEGCFTREFTNFMRDQHEFVKMSSGRIYNTCRVIESPFLDLLARPEITGSQKQWALGPFNPVTSVITNHETIERRNSQSSSSSATSSGKYCMEWLDRQAPKSVIFVSFGTTTTLSDEQSKELAIGLEKSEVNFIWVLRDADRGHDNVCEDREVVHELPKGFEERVKERGIILRDWAPQLKILGHSAIGGFLSHCGWNSCMESISMGVPIAAWPMHSDQPRNTVLVTKILKIGVVVKDWAKRSETVRASTVTSALKKLMKSKEGEEIRHRAKELGVAVRRAAAHGGATCLELDSFISHITRL